MLTGYALNLYVYSLVSLQYYCLTVLMFRRGIIQVVIFPQAEYALELDLLACLLAWFAGAATPFVEPEMIHESSADATAIICVRL